MNKRTIFVGILAIVLIIGVFMQSNGVEPETPNQNTTDDPVSETVRASRIASWLAKKGDLIASGKPYDLVMAGWFSPDEAVQLRENNPDVILLAGLSCTWIWDNQGWMDFLITVASYGQDEPFVITEDMYLHNQTGGRCAFGWASEEWQQEEIYGMDPRNSDWVELILSFYENVIDQPQHDGIIVDMVVEKQYWCPNAITDEEWLNSTKDIYKKLKELKTEDKLVIFNAGGTLEDINEYSDYFDGYLMENYLGTQMKTNFTDGLEAADSDYIVIYNVDTDDTGVVDVNRMRLGYSLSLLNDNTYFTYDFGPRDHGQAWWYPEYDVKLGDPKGEYYMRENAYWREFEKGYVVAAPVGAQITFTSLVTDVTNNQTSTSFTITEGDGRIYLKTD